MERRKTFSPDNVIILVVKIKVTFVEMGFILRPLIVAVHLSPCKCFTRDRVSSFCARVPYIIPVSLRTVL